MTKKRQMQARLQPWSVGDLALLERLMGEPGMTEHLGGPETLDQIRAHHDRYCQRCDPGGMFVILAGQERQPAGSIGYWERTWHSQLVWETGWSVLPEFQGQGIASQAARLVIGCAWAEGTHRFLHAFPSPDNIPSNAICRKADFVLIGEVDFEYPPGRFMRCNDLRLDLFADISDVNPTILSRKIGEYL